MGARVLNLRNWLDRAICDEDEFDFTPPTETLAGLEVAQRWCNICPVREECLMTAMRNGWQGYWGGTMTADRRKLKALKYRAKCPCCLSVNVVTVSTSQVCIACGRSWAVARAPVPAEPKRPSETSADPREEEVTIVGDML